MRDLKIVCAQSFSDAEKRIPIFRVTIRGIIKIIRRIIFPTRHLIFSVKVGLLCPPYSLLIVISFLTILFGPKKSSNFAQFIMSI